MKSNYLDNVFPPYMIFGAHKDGLRVDVASINGDIVTGIPRFEAIRLIKDRDKVLQFLFVLANALQEADSKKFDEIWDRISYGI